MLCTITMIIIYYFFMSAILRCLLFDYYSVYIDVLLSRNVNFINASKINQKNETKINPDKNQTYGSL